MRRIIAGAFVSLDNVMQAPGGPEEDPTCNFEYGGWVAPYWDEAVDASMTPLFEEPFDLLLGRKTYEIFAAHWPHYDDEPIGQAFNRAAKYVVTSSTEPLPWANSHAIRDGSEGVARLKQGSGPTLVIQGSSGLYPDLLARGLIDRLYLKTFPVLLGKGKRLFGQDGASGALKLVASEVSQSGVVLATYEPAGPVQTGSFQTKEPSEEELERRERMKVEG